MERLLLLVLRFGGRELVRIRLRLRILERGRCLVERALRLLERLQVLGGRPADESCNVRPVLDLEDVDEEFEQACRLVEVDVDRQECVAHRVRGLRVDVR